MYLLLNADVYSPQALGQCHLLVAANRIVWMGEQVPELPRALGVETIDVQGRRLIPGLIDAHAHITGGGGESGFSSRVPPVDLSRFTSNAVTTVVGLLGTDDIVRNTAALVAQARALNEEGLTCYCYTGGYHLPPTTLTGSVQSDIVHIDPIIGVGELAISDHRSSQPTIDEFLRIASQVHVAGMMTGKAGVLHLHLGDGERGLELVRLALSHSEIPPRVFNPTHVNRRKALFEESVELAAVGCNIDLTAFPVSDDDDGWTAAEGLLRYFDSGVPPDRVTVSSDGGGCLPHFDTDGRITHMGIGDPKSLLETLQTVLQSGIDLAQVLPAFTKNVADFLRLEGKGNICVGAHADLVVLDEASNPSDVMVLGRWHRRSGQTVIRGRFESVTN